MSTENRPSKKQRALLLYIEAFIRMHGFGPSYREIMQAMQYKSVSTVAIHIDNLITKGHLSKRSRSARSLEVVNQTAVFKESTKRIPTTQQKWLVDRVSYQFAQTENAPTQKAIDNLYVLVGALQVLGLEDAARSFKARLMDLPTPD